jgi:hypothetical protein
MQSMLMLQNSTNSATVVSCRDGQPLMQSGHSESAFGEKPCGPPGLAGGGGPLYSSPSLVGGPSLADPG